MLAGSSLFSISNALGGTDHTDGSNYDGNGATNGNSDTDDDGGYGANDSGEEIDGGGGGDNNSDDESRAVKSSEPLVNEVRLAYEKGQSCALHHILKLYI